MVSGQGAEVTTIGRWRLRRSNCRRKFELSRHRPPRSCKALPTPRRRFARRVRSGSAICAGAEMRPGQAVWRLFAARPDLHRPRLPKRSLQIFPEVVIAGCRRRCPCGFSPQGKLAPASDRRGCPIPGTGRYIKPLAGGFPVHGTAIRSHQRCGPESGDQAPASEQESLTCLLGLHLGHAREVQTHRLNIKTGATVGSRSGAR